MKAQHLKGLEELGRGDPALAVMAKLMLELSRASADPAWEDSAGSPTTAPLGEGIPLLQGATVRVPMGELASLLARLARISDRGGPPLEALGRREESAIRLIEASINQDAEAVEELAHEAGLEAPALSTFGQLAATPLLLAWGEKVAPLLSGSRWGRGYCPVCAAWPTLSEVRGTHRETWLRCGRCGTGWVHPPMRCAYCDNGNHATLGYLAAESEMESRRADSCRQCRGYLKSFATLGPLDWEEIALRDLTSVELDIEAMNRGFSRPETPAYPLWVTAVPA